MKPILIAMILLGLSGPGMADDLPNDFYGTWQDTYEGYSPIIITAKTSFQAGYGCRFIKVNFIPDSSNTVRHVASIDAICQEDGASPPPPERVHQVWALRPVDGKPFLVIATPSSIQIFKDRTTK